MTELSKEILNNYQVRKTTQQKTRFIELLLSHFPDAVVEEGGLLHSRNIVIGDITRADVIFTAHYDTCAKMPVPNFIAPKNLLLTILYSILLCVPMFLAASAASFLAGLLTDSFAVSYFSFLVVLFGLLALMFVGKPNEHTANDNTSGVVMLCELIGTCGDNAAFVFFDNEENGLLGSAQFRKKHKTETSGKLLINFDCVSDGGHIMLVQSKKAKSRFGHILESSFTPTDGKTLHFESSAGAIYPSDQAQFPFGVGVAVLKKKPVIGLYLDRIHTNRDTVFDESNIEYLCLASRRLASAMDSIPGS